MRLTRVFTSGHLYNENGHGFRTPDLSALHPNHVITRTIDLPGFVETREGDFGHAHSVTYESHHFWLHFLTWQKSDGTLGIQDRQALLVVHHGAGWEVWKVDYLLAAALAAYGEDRRGLFKLCWSLADMHRELIDQGRVETRTEIFRAYIDGRLKKRKLPARGKVKVWVEPATGPSTDTLAA